MATVLSSLDEKIGCVNLKDFSLESILDPGIVLQV